jgi:hypothetical protein
MTLDFTGGWWRRQETTRFVLLRVMIDHPGLSIHLLATCQCLHSSFEIPCSVFDIPIGRAMM